MSILRPPENQPLTPEPNADHLRLVFGEERSNQLLDQVVPNYDRLAQSIRQKVYRSDDPTTGELVKARGLDIHTQVYKRAGYITDADIKNGFYIDPYTERSVYFYMISGSDKEATVRQIETDKTGLASLPTLEYFECNPEVAAATAGVNNLSELSRKEVVEISGLSAQRIQNGETTKRKKRNIRNSDTLAAVPSLYAEMLRVAIEKGHRLWVSNMEESLISSISMMIGNDQLVSIGKPKKYMGDPTTPIAINPRKVIESLFTVKEGEPEYMEFYRQYLRDTLKDVNVDKVPKSFRKVLENAGVETQKSSLAKRTLKSKEAIAQAAIFAYSAGRVVPAATQVEQFHGSKTGLISLDLATSVTYTHGLVKLYSGKSFKDRVMGAAFAIPSFLAPYAYFYAEGRDYPMEVNGVAAALVLTGLGAEVKRRQNAKRTDKKVEQDKTPDFKH